MLKGYADSIAFELDESIISSLNDFGVVATVKNDLVFCPDLMSIFISKRTPKARAKQLKQLHNLWRYLAIVETSTGLQYKIVQHMRAKKAHITFQGLRQYNEASKLMKHDLKEFIELFGHGVTLMRLDIALDSPKGFSVNQLAKNSKRKPMRYKNTTYFKTAKEKSTNRNYDIKLYYKDVINAFRLEFCFKKSYMNKNDLPSSIEKTISKIVKQPFKLTKPLY